jgi:predicted ATPase/DNA-binding winged helix-turn-helix (wHTH) protein
MMGPVIFGFDEFEIDTGGFELRFRGEPRHLEPQVFDVLRYLVEHRDRVVSKEELLDRVWGDRFVSESALTSRVKAARQAVGDTGRSQRVISTVHGRGYRFVAPVVAGDRAAAGTTSTTSSTIRSITAPPDPLIGRTDDLERMTRALADARLVTLVGPGGVGKTRLAVEFARRCRLDSRLVDLSRVEDGRAVAGAFLETLDVSPRRGVTDCDRIVETLDARSLLLVVDNCEHVVDAVAEVLGRVQREAADVRIVATSRQAIDVAGEHVLVVAPLGLPPDRASDAAMRESEAVRLFCDRTDRAGAEVGELGTVVTLCRRLDGIPLALELAAARTRAFSPAQILEQLDAGWSPSTPRRDEVPAHHRSLDEAIEWSFRLLDDGERDLLLTAGIFRGPFDLAAATAVAGDEPVTIADRLAQLVDKSLVQSVTVRAGRRFRLLETIRTFALSKMDPEAAAVRRERHCAHFTREVAALGGLVPGPDEGTAAARLADDFDDVSEAFAFAATRGDVDAAVVLASGPRLSVSTDGARWALLALRATELPGVEQASGYASLLAGAAWGAVVIGDLPHARALAEEGVAAVGDVSQDARLCWIRPQATGSSFVEGADHCVAGALAAAVRGDRAAASFLLGTASIYRLAAGDEPLAVEHARSALDLAQRVGSRTLRIRAASALAYALQDVDAAAARRAADEVLEITPSTDFHQSMPLRVLAILAWRAGDRTAAADYTARAIELVRSQGDRYVQATAMHQLAVLAGSVDPALAAEILGIGESLVPDVRLSARDAAAVTRLRAELLEGLGADRFAEYVDRGRHAEANSVRATMDRAVDRLRGP